MKTYSGHHILSYHSTQNTPRAYVGKPTCLWFPSWVASPSGSPPYLCHKCRVPIFHNICVTLCVSHLCHTICHICVTLCVTLCINYIIFAKYDKMLRSVNSQVWKLWQVLYGSWLCHSQKSNSIFNIHREGWQLMVSQFCLFYYINRLWLIWLSINFR